MERENGEQNRVKHDADNHYDGWSMTTEDDRMMMTVMVMSIQFKQ